MSYRWGQLTRYLPAYVQIDGLPGRVISGDVARIVQELKQDGIPYKIETRNNKRAVWVDRKAMLQVRGVTHEYWKEEEE